MRGQGVRRQLRLRPHALWFPNGSVITLDRVLIVNETFGNRCTAFDLTQDGRLVNRRTLAEFAPLPSYRAGKSKGTSCSTVTPTAW